MVSSKSLINLVPDNLKPLLPIEEKLIKAIPLGLKVSGLPEGNNDMTQIGEPQSIRCEILIWVLTTTEICKKIHHKGIFLSGVKLLGVLNLEDSRIECPLRLINCIIEEDMILERGNYVLLDFTGSHTRSILANSIQVQHNVLMKDGFKAKGKVSLVGAYIGGDLECIGGDFENPEDDALFGDGLKTNGDIFFRDGFKSKGVVRLIGANIGGNLECVGGEFDNPGGVALFCDSLITIGSVFLCEGFKAKGEVRLIGADIGNTLACHEGLFENPNGNALSADGLKIKGAVFLREGFKANGEVRLYGADISNHLDCSGGEFENSGGVAIGGDGIITKGPIFLNNGFKAKGEVCLVGANIGGNLDCSNGEFENPEGIALFGDNMKVSGSLRWRRLRAKPKGKLSLENATLGNLEDDENSWPEPGNLNIDGLTYGPFTYQVPAESKSRLRWLNLRNHNNFNVQPYEQLIRVFQQMGLRDYAHDVAIAKQKAIREKLRGISRLWNWILDITISYGYKPEKVILLFILPIILLGSLVFTLAFRVGAIESTISQEQLADKTLTFDPVGYSVDVFLPIVDLHQESAWEPNASTKYGIYIQYYMYFHIITGWFFTTLAVAAVTGLVRRD